MKKILFVILLFHPIIKILAFNTDTMRSEMKFILNKNDCPENQMGKESFEYTIISKAFKDTIGLIMPTNKALADTFKQRSQNEINKQATCIVIYANEKKTKTIVKNNCPKDSFGALYEYNIPIKKYVNTISADSVNTKADKDLADSAQIKANMYGTCKAYFYNDTMSKSAQKNGGIDSVGRMYTYKIPAKKYKDSISVLIANNKARKDLEDSTQIKANLYGICMPKIKYVIKEVKVIKKVCKLDEDRYSTFSKNIPLLNSQCPIYPTSTTTTTFDNRP